MEEKKLKIPEGDVFDRVENGEVILRKVGGALPKTWADCLSKPGGGNRLGEMEDLNCHSSLNAVPKGMRKPMLALCQLLVCRNAWWKRLGWKPDWKNQEQKKYCIGFIKGRVDTTMNEGSNRILAFPTPEAQGEFLRTFRDLIVEAKELL